MPGRRRPQGRAPCVVATGLHRRRRVVSRMLANFDIPISWPELIKRTAKQAMSDDAQGLASQLAFYFVLALFPALLCLLAIASFLPLQNFTGDVVRLLGPFAPREVIDIIRQEMLKISEG